MSRTGCARLAALAIAAALAASLCPSARGDSIVHVAPEDESHVRHVRRLLRESPHLDVLHSSLSENGQPLMSVLAGSEAAAAALSGRLAGVPHRVEKRAASFDELAELFAPRRRADDGIFRAGQDMRTYAADKFYRSEDIINFIDQAKAQFGSRVEKITIGQSYEGRKIYLLKITSDRNRSPLKKAVFVDAGIHPREWIAPATAMHLVWALLTQSLRNAAARRLLDTADVYVAPNVNPDGYEYTWNNMRYWRKNRGPERCNFRCCAVGADLNRNFPFHYGESGSSRHPCEETYMGNASLSEPESRALASALRSLAGRVRLYATLHSFGQTVLVPYGYAVGARADNYERMMDVAGAGVRAMSMVGGAAYSALDSAKLYPAAGGSDDWAHGALGIPYAYTIELRPSPPNGIVRLRHFAPPASQVPPSGRELLAGLDAMWQRIRQLHDEGDDT